MTSDIKSYEAKLLKSRRSINAGVSIGYGVAFFALAIGLAELLVLPKNLQLQFDLPLLFIGLIILLQSKAMRRHLETIDRMVPTETDQQNKTEPTS